VHFCRLLVCLCFHQFLKWGNDERQRRANLMSDAGKQSELVFLDLFVITGHFQYATLLLFVAVIYDGEVDTCQDKQQVNNAGQDTAVPGV